MRRFQNLHLLSLGLLILLSQSAWAKVTGLMTWKVNGVTLILPRLSETPPKATPELYKKALQTSPAYQVSPSLFENTDLTKSETTKNGLKKEAPQPEISDLLPFKPNEDLVPFALFANSKDLMTPNGKPYQHFKEWTASAGAVVYVVPLGIETILPKKEDLTTYFNLISKQFPALIAPGGNDLDPSLYGEKNLHSTNIHPSLDSTEILFIRDFIATGHGMFYGVCRGHQAYAVAVGGKLIQDLPMQLSPNVIHRPTKNPDGTFSSSWHSISLSNKDNILFQTLNKESFLVNSRHHQAVQSIPPGKGDVIALAGGNVIEALEKKDDQGKVKVLTFQFHPEDMETPESDKIIKLMVDQTREVLKSNSPEKK